ATPELVAGVNGFLAKYGPRFDVEAYLKDHTEGSGPRSGDQPGVECDCLLEHGNGIASGFFGVNGEDGKWPRMVCNHNTHNGWLLQEFIDNHLDALGKTVEYLWEYVLDKQDGEEMELPELPFPDYETVKEAARGLVERAAQGDREGLLEAADLLAERIGL